jgi:hypothetical protein
MSLQVHHTVQIHDEIEKIWDDYRKSSAAVRFVGAALVQLPWL